MDDLMHARPHRPLIVLAVILSSLNTGAISTEAILLPLAVDVSSSCQLKSTVPTRQRTE